MSDKWLAVNPTPNPLPPDWNNPNVWIPCTVNGAAGSGKLTLVDQSTVPPTPVSWSTFTGNTTNPNWVPNYAGPMIVGAPGNAGTFSIIINMHKYKWAGGETCVWHGDRTGFWQVTGINYDSGAYPQ